MSTLPTYVAQPLPQIEGGQTRHLKANLQSIQSTLAAYQNALPQPATSVPAVLSDGLVRLARAPWHPASGQTTDAWVYYDAPSKTWKLL